MSFVCNYDPLPHELTCFLLIQYYTVAVGKLNVPKMANFLEIDLFVLVSCPENSLIDSQGFFKPVVTPYEMEIACLRYVNYRTSINDSHNYDFCTDSDNWEVLLSS